MKLKDILSKEEIQNYHQQWDLFKQKYASAKNHEIESEYNTHSGWPVISKVFQYKDYPIFRTHVFQKRLRKIDPYFTSLIYPNPFWHGTHYFVVAEQLFHASSHLVRDNSKIVTIEKPLEFQWRLPIFWDKSISIELIQEKLEKKEDNLQEKENFTLYNIRNRAISRMYFLTYQQPRSYIRCIKQLEQGDKIALEKLIRQIEMQDVNHKRLIKPRINLPEKDYLISELKNGRIPKEELDDFFSSRDKNS